MFSSFMRFFRYFHVSSPSSMSAQSGPRQMKRCRFSLPTPKAAADSSGLVRFFPIALRARRLELAATSFTRAAAALLDEIGRHTSELQSPCNLVCRLLLEK